jgi:ribose transport system permease protein
MSKATAVKEETPVKTDSPLKQVLRWEASGVLIALIVLCLVLSLVSPNFLNSYNLTVVIRQASFVGLVALGQTLVLLLGGIDLSLGACASFSAIVGSLMLKSAGVHPWLVIPLTALFGLSLGLLNGLFVARLKLNPFIVTLASGAIFAGLTLVITKGYPIRPLGPGFTVFGQGDILGIPLPVTIFLGAAAILVWMLRLTPFGRNIYAIGGNRDAAVLVGIPVARVEMFAYGLAGMFAALAGILYASRMDSGQPAVGEGWLMGAITAAILGGTSLKGGQGTVIGTVFGTLLMAVVSNGLSLLNVSGYWERVVVGAIVLVAVLTDLLRHRE